MTRWPVISAAIAAGFLAGAVAFPRAQQSRSDNVVVTKIEPGALTEPLPVLSARRPPIQVGGVYEIYFNNLVYVPGLGPRPKLFVQVSSMSADGWYDVTFGDEVENKGRTDARVVAVSVPDLDPQVVLHWRLYYASIAAASPNLNTSGIDALALQHWPE